MRGAKCGVWGSSDISTLQSFKLYTLLLKALVCTISNTHGQLEVQVKPGVKTAENDSRYRNHCVWRRSGGHVAQ